MSAKKELQIQMDGAPSVGPPHNPGTVSAADMMGQPMPAEETERRKGLPAEGEAWTHKHDMVVMGRLGRAVEGVPAAALRRIMPWFEGVTREVMYPAAAPGMLKELAAAGNYPMGAPPAETSGGLKVYR